MVAAGFAGGAISGVVCGPMELVMIQQQRFGGSLLGTPSRIMTGFGPMQMFRGLTTACGREGIFAAGYLGLGPALGSFFAESQGMTETSAKVMAAVTAGVAAATLSHPIDTVKTCMQGDLERKVYQTVTKTASTLYQEGGIRRLFRGWGWRTGRTVLSTFLLNEFRIHIATVLFPRHFRDE